jgi:hypothetical protein
VRRGLRNQEYQIANILHTHAPIAVSSFRRLAASMLTGSRILPSLDQRRPRVPGALRFAGNQALCSKRKAGKSRRYLTMASRIRIGNISGKQTILSCEDIEV